MEFANPIKEIRKSKRKRKDFGSLRQNIYSLEEDTPAVQLSRVVQTSDFVALIRVSAAISAIRWWFLYY